jgi:ribosome-associated protein
MKTNDVKAQVAIAVKACQEKKAEDINVLRLDAASGLTDYFVISSGTNPRQVEAIAEAVDEHLSKAGQEPTNVEGRRSENWIALDYGDFMVHVFSQGARKFYDLERLWKTAIRVDIADLLKPGAKKASPKKAAKKSSPPTPSTSSGQALSKKMGKDGAPTFHETAAKRTKKGK